jgi:putative oxygen-independent coproporphyrinogen III oxidase
MQDWQHGGFGLYIHWPFCQSKCPYCDFNSHVSERIDQKRWEKAYLAEIDRISTLTEGRILRSVFFGGGTPSLMEPDLVAAIMGRIRARWQTTNDWEVTLEANPGSVEAGRFRGFSEAGINRVSMGIQALNDGDLRRLGRVHTVAEAKAAFDIARKTFRRVSFDLIYARQDQTLQSWGSELTEALNMAADHLSLYQLTIEEGTVFGARLARGQLRGLPGEDAAVDMYNLTQDLCGAAGLNAYEVSNHAADGAESRHNLIYWQGGDYAGIGPGAHGRLTLGGQRQASVGWMAPGAWLKSVESTGCGDESMEVLSAEEHAQEYMMMSLRLADGMNRTRFRDLGGSECINKINSLRDLGLLDVSANKPGWSPAVEPDFPIPSGLKTILQECRAARPRGQNTMHPVGRVSGIESK